MRSYFLLNFPEFFKFDIDFIFDSSAFTHSLVIVSVYSLSSLSAVYLALKLSRISLSIDSVAQSLSSLKSNSIFSLFLSSSAALYLLALLYSS